MIIDGARTHYYFTADARTPAYNIGKQRRTIDARDRANYTT